MNISRLEITCFDYEDITYFRWSETKWYEELTCGDLVYLYGCEWLEEAFQAQKRLDRLRQVGLV